MIPSHPPLGRKFVLYLMRTLRLILALYLVGLSIVTIIISGIKVHVGGIIASIYLIPISLVFVALELGFLHSHIGVLKHETQPFRIIGLQFISAMITGVAWPNVGLFIFCCVAFGLSLGLMNFGIYYSFWRHYEQEYEHNGWGEDDDKSPKSAGQIFSNGDDEEEDALLIWNGSEVQVESTRPSRTSLTNNGPEIMSVD